MRWLPIATPWRSTGKSRSPSAGNTGQAPAAGPGDSVPASAARYLSPGAASKRRATSSGLRITGGLRGSRTVIIPTRAPPRPSVTPKKKRKAETPAFMAVAEAPLDRRCSR